MMHSQLNKAKIILKYFLVINSLELKLRPTISGVNYTLALSPLYMHSKIILALNLSLEFIEKIP